MPDTNAAPIRPMAGEHEDTALWVLRTKLLYVHPLEEGKRRSPHFPLPVGARAFASCISRLATPQPPPSPPPLLLNPSSHTPPPPTTHLPATYIYAEVARPAHVSEHRVVPHRVPAAPRGAGRRSRSRLAACAQKQGNCEPREDEVWFRAPRSQAVQRNPRLSEGVFHRSRNKRR